MVAEGLFPEVSLGQGKMDTARGGLSGATAING